jgi:ornithine cyclodeaminase
MKIITVESLTRLIARHGYDKFLLDLMHGLKKDFGRWEVFTQMPRPAMHVPGGVLELMPVCDNEKYYSFKYVNCHPKNTLSGNLTVVATGQLVDVATGYPLMFCEMTILTALRTAAMSALATDMMSRKESKTLAIIGTGAQAEFQLSAISLVRKIKEVRFFDLDGKAMDKFEENVKNKSLNLRRCASAEEAVNGADIITVCTAKKARVAVVKDKWIQKGVHINALGGDTIGKTELERSTLFRSRIAVEYFAQAYIEGEIQRFSKKEALQNVTCEFFEIINGLKKGRESKDEITLFDSVGIALEDYSALRLTYELSRKYNIGENFKMVPELSDPKDLISLLL